MNSASVLQYRNHKQIKSTTNTLQVEIGAEDLLSLLANKQLAASQLKCLNSNTKSLLCRLLLESCL
jgi:hypothetical protein